jgi:septum site-determining protein MinC
MAGARGNADARIFALVMEPELLSVAGVYRTSETPLPEGIRGRAAQVYLQSTEQGDKLIMEPLA